MLHKLQTLDSYILRDDLLGWQLTGSKARKYTTLLPSLKGMKKVILVGGCYSNHLLGLSQLLIQQNVTPYLIMQGRPEFIGNQMMLQTLVPPENRRYVQKDIEQEAKKWQEEIKADTIIAEGGSVEAAMEGSLTLPIDILRHEHALGLHFDHIYMDAGTGMLASALIIGLQAVKHPAKIHILSLADTPEVFWEKFALYSEWSKLDLPKPTNVIVEQPKTLKSFGSTNNKLFQFIVDFSRAEGIFLDPIYSAKLMLYAKEKLVEGNNLIIHSGGAQTLYGFPESLEKCAASHS